MDIALTVVICAAVAGAAFGLLELFEHVQGLEKLTKKVVALVGFVACYTAVYYLIDGLFAVAFAFSSAWLVIPATIAACVGTFYLCRLLVISALGAVGSCCQAIEAGSKLQWAPEAAAA